MDNEQLKKLTDMNQDDVYLSDSSPLGLPFWNLRTSASEEARRRRIAARKPGSSCPKGFLRLNTEFTKVPICPASRTYQQKKLHHLREEGLPAVQVPVLEKETLDKSCICHDLAGSATLKYGIDPEATPAICCGPNIVNFRKIASLEDMVAHIYGRLSLLTSPERSHMFIQELKLYVIYLRQEAEKYSLELSARPPKYFSEFKENLTKGIEYYRRLGGQFIDEQRERFRQELAALQAELDGILLPADQPAEA